MQDSVMHFNRLNIVELSFQSSCSTHLRDEVVAVVDGGFVHAKPLKQLPILNACPVDHRHQPPMS